jgi:hypothetical protein
MCKHEWTEWEEWINPVPTYFHSLRNKIRRCKKCEVIQFKYEPEGKEKR